MIKKINDFLAGLPMTIVGGVFLIASFVLGKMETKLPFDPAWVTVVICGILLLYLSVRRIIHTKGISKISSASSHSRTFSDRQQRKWSKSSVRSAQRPFC